jgi:hypothetical protein
MSSPFPPADPNPQGRTFLRCRKQTAPRCRRTQAWRPLSDNRARCDARPAGRTRFNPPTPHPPGLTTAPWLKRRCAGPCCPPRIPRVGFVRCKGWADGSSASGRRRPRTGRRPGLTRSIDRRCNMERHLSTGVATIVALMAADRAASARAAAAPAHDPASTDRIDACLRGFLGMARPSKHRTGPSPPPNRDGTTDPG